MEDWRRPATRSSQCTAWLDIGLKDRGLGHCLSFSSRSTRIRSFLQSTLLTALDSYPPVSPPSRRPLHRLLLARRPSEHRLRATKEFASKTSLNHDGWPRRSSGPPPSSSRSPSSFSPSQGPCSGTERSRRLSSSGESGGRMEGTVSTRLKCSREEIPLVALERVEEEGGGV